VINPFSADIQFFKLLIKCACFVLPGGKKEDGPICTGRGRIRWQRCGSAHRGGSQIHLQDMTTPCKKEIARILPFLGLMINIYRHDKYAAIQASYRSLP